MSEVELTVPHESRFGALRELLPRRFFLETWNRIDVEAAAEREARRAQGASYDYRPLIALATGAMFLTAMEYWGGSRYFDRFVLTFHLDAMFGSQFADLYELGYWALWRVLGYFILPVVVLKLMGLRVRDHGLSTQGFREHAWIYGFFYSIVLVAVVIVSFFGDFSTYYPFYKLANRSWFDFAIWELLYAAQFFSLEFFFRGFWLTACRSMFGSGAIFAMVVPYCMIHYGKPVAEAYAAILAGVVLGTLAMKTRSIWSGFLIHVSVAISMDVAALLQTRGLPNRWWP